MGSAKKYTNRNFTKRVDHEAGHKAPNPAREPAVCKDCGAVYLRGHWTLNNNVLASEDRRRPAPLETVCPACVQIAHGEPAGFVYLDGEFYESHRTEIENLLRNENDRAMEVNPLARIIEWHEADHRLTVTTTTEHLAQQLGHSLQQAFDGHVRYDFSHENKLARVYWHR